MRIIILLISILLAHQLSAQILLDDRNKSVELYNQANQAFQNKNFTLAIKLIQESLKLDSTNRNAYLIINQSYSVIKDYSSQEKFLLKAKSIFLEDDELCYYLGKLYQKRKEYDKAIAELSKAIKYSKKNGEDYPIVYDYYSSRGTCFMKKNMFEKALMDYNYAIKLNNSKKHIYANRAVVNFKLNNAEQACKDWRKAKKLGSNRVQKYIDKYCK